MLGVGEAFGVDAEEDGDAVAGPFGDLGGSHAGVEPGGQAGVAQVVGAFGQWGGVYRFKTNRTVSDLVFIRSAHAAW